MPQIAHFFSMSSSVVGTIRVPYLSEPHPDCQAGSHCLSGGSRRSLAAVSFNCFRGGMQQACPEGPHRLSPLWCQREALVPLSNDVCQKASSGKKDAY